jgi:hypothetical protein
LVGNDGDEGGHVDFCHNFNHQLFF